MDSRVLRRRNHSFVDRLRLFATGALPEARDILLDRAFEERRLLRHVAEIFAELVLVPVGQPRTVDPDRSDRGLDGADYDLAERGLS